MIFQSIDEIIDWNVLVEATHVNAYDTGPNRLNIHDIYIAECLYNIGHIHSHGLFINIYRITEAHWHNLEISTWDKMTYTSLMHEYLCVHMIMDNFES